MAYNLGNPYNTEPIQNLNHSSDHVALLSAIIRVANNTTPGKAPAKQP